MSTNPLLRPNPSRDPYSHTPEGFVRLDMRNYKPSAPAEKYTPLLFKRFLGFVAQVLGVLATLFVAWILIWAFYFIVNPVPVPSAYSPSGSAEVSSALRVDAPPLRVDAPFYPRAFGGSAESALSLPVSSNDAGEAFYIDPLIASGVLERPDVDQGWEE